MQRWLHTTPWATIRVHDHTIEPVRGDPLAIGLRIEVPQETPHVTIALGGLGDAKVDGDRNDR